MKTERGRRRIFPGLAFHCMQHVGNDFNIGTPLCHVKQTRVRVVGFEPTWAEAPHTLPPDLRLHLFKEALNPNQLSR